MAKPIASNKRDNEKKKQSKRLEKQKKKELRKTDKGKGFEDMIAYVDENGLITTTPPNTDKKTKINVEDIEVSVPTKEKTEDSVLKGRVEHFNEEKGYGFIKHLASVDKYFFHVNNCNDRIKEGNIVLFELERGTRGMNAVNVRIEK